MKIEIPSFEDKSELFDFLISNKSALIAQKKFEIKKGDDIPHLPESESKESVNKAESDVDNNATELRVKAVINTTNVMDSHSDVHFPGIWNKSIRENKNIYHLQEHKMQFDKVISDSVKVSAKTMTWEKLGYSYPGETQALVFDSKVEKEDNPFMFKKYNQGKVKNHSVGMRYVKLALAINNDEYKEEFETWEKYADLIVNKKVAEKQGYFWAVTEAKVIEGSAVLLGSNPNTPTISVQSKEIEEPLKDTPATEPTDVTHNNLIKHLLTN